MISHIPYLFTQERSELHFCLTDSSGLSLFGVSLQTLCPLAPPSSANSNHTKRRPMALCILSGRPLYSGFSRLVQSLMPLAQQVRL